ncbi:unnamed protein product, partial [marine sediment metagenome]
VVSGALDKEQQTADTICAYVLKKNNQYFVYLSREIVSDVVS